MSQLTPEQRDEVKEIVAYNNPVLISSIKDSMNQIIDPLKESVNRSLGNYDMLNSKIDENTKKNMQLFDFHNENVEDVKKKDLTIMSLEKDIEKLESDLNAIGVKLSENIKKDEHFERVVRDAQSSYNTLSKIGTVAFTVIGLIIAWLELK